MAIIDWFSRYVLAWRISNTLDGDFCRQAVIEAFQDGQPEIFKTDQGVQFTAWVFTDQIDAAGGRMSMDGRGRALDKVFIERLWRSVKYEDVYVHNYPDGAQLHDGLGRYFRFYSRTPPSKFEVSDAGGRSFWGTVTLHLIGDDFWS